MAISNSASTASLYQLSARRMSALGLLAVLTGLWIAAMNSRETSTTLGLHASVKKMIRTHELPEACQPYVKNRTLSLTHGRYIKIPGRKPPYDHSCFIMKPRYNCATANMSKPKAYEWIFVIQSDPEDDDTLCDIQAVVDDIGGPAAVTPNSSAAVFGNSFSRQTFEALACKYQNQLTAALVTENPPDISLAAFRRRNYTPFNESEYGTIVRLPLDKQPIPLCVGDPDEHKQFFEPNVVLRTDHHGKPCSDNLAMMEYGGSLRVFYNFRPETLENTFESYKTKIGLNIPDLEHVAYNHRAGVHLMGHSSGHTTWQRFSEVKPTLQQILERDSGRWFGADNPWITQKPDSHPCMPGVPDDLAALFLFSIFFGINGFDGTVRKQD